MGNSEKIMPFLKYQKYKNCVKYKIRFAFSYKEDNFRLGIYSVGEKETYRVRMSSVKAVGNESKGFDKVISYPQSYDEMISLIDEYKTL